MSACSYYFTLISDNTGKLCLVIVTVVQQNFGCANGFPYVNCRALGHSNARFEKPLCH